MKRFLRRMAGAAFVHGLLLAGAAIMIVPLAWMLSTSLKETGFGLSSKIEWLPWRDVWSQDGRDVTVAVLGARVRAEGAREPVEIGIASLEDRGLHSRALLPGGVSRVAVEVIEWQITRHPHRWC